MNTSHDLTAQLLAVLDDLDKAKELREYGFVEAAAHEKRARAALANLLSTLIATA